MSTDPLVVTTYLGHTKWFCDTFEQAAAFAATESSNTGVPHTVHTEPIPHVGDFWTVEREP